MNCTHVLDLIDAGTLAAYPAAHLDEAWRHARGCATCGPALVRAQALGGHLQTMPLPPEPPDFAAAVMARIARLDDPVMPEPARIVPAARHTPVWGTTAGGVLAVAAIGALSTGGGIDIVSGGLGHISLGMLATSTQPVAAVALILGLLMYVRGLFTAFGVERPGRM